MKCISISHVFYLSCIVIINRGDLQIPLIIKDDIIITTDINRYQTCATEIFLALFDFYYNLKTNVNDRFQLHKNKYLGITSVNQTVAIV